MWLCSLSDKDFLGDCTGIIFDPWVFSNPFPIVCIYLECLIVIQIFTFHRVSCCLLQLHLFTCESPSLSAVSNFVFASFLLTILPLEAPEVLFPPARSCPVALASQQGFACNQVPGTAIASRGISQGNHAS